jgi:hypothetical protein
MPDQGGGRPAVKPHVQKHLQKRDVDHKQLPDEVIAALNDCSEGELNAMDRLGETMEKADVDVSVRITMVH